MSRVSGVAPLTVFFDATSTSSPATTLPFHEIEYRWNFGDTVFGAAGSCGTALTAGQGYWACGNNPGVNSKNAATGPVAAHVFETPGTYNISLTAKDGANPDASNSCTQITVSDPNTVFAGTTTCISTSGNFAGCPSGASQVTSSDFEVATSAALAAGKRRILFRRGETFIADALPASTVRVSQAGPGLIGSYAGTGSTAKILATFSSSFTPTLDFFPGANDWRVMDLEFDGTGTPVSSNGIQGENGANQILVLRANIHDFGHYSTKFNNGDENAVVDTLMGTTRDAFGFGTFSGTINGYLAIMGSSVNLGAGNGGHALRFPGASMLVVSNNTLTPGAGFTNIDAHGFSTNGAWTGKYAEKQIYSDNKFISSTAFFGHVAIGPQNAQSNEPMRNIIAERNSFGPGGGSTGLIAFSISARLVTLRNNTVVSQGNNSDRFAFIDIKNSAGIEPAPQDIWVYNNSMYTTTTSGFTMVTLSPRDDRVTLKNNVAYAPNAANSAELGAGPAFTASIGGSATNTVASNNSSNAQIKSTTPLFTVGPPLITGPATNWKPTCTGATYPCGQGVSVPVRSDLLFTTQPGIRDMGAVVH